MPTLTKTDISDITDNLFSDYSPDGENNFCLTYSPSRGKLEIELLTEHLQENFQRFVNRNNDDKRLFLVSSDVDDLLALKKQIEPSIPFYKKKLKADSTP